MSEEFEARWSRAKILAGITFFAVAVGGLVSGCKSSGSPADGDGVAALPTPSASASALPNPGSTTPEASAPTTVSATTICANLDAWALNSPERAYLDCSELKKALQADPETTHTEDTCVASLANVAATTKRTITNPKLDASTRKQVLTTLAESLAERQATSLQATLSVIRDHVASTSEDRVKMSLVSDYGKVIEGFQRWAKYMRGYDGTLGDIGALTASTEKIIDDVSLNEGMRYRRCATLDKKDGGTASDQADNGAGDASLTATRARTNTQPAVPRVVRTTCPNGQQAFLRLFHLGGLCFCGTKDSVNEAPEPDQNRSQPVCSAYATDGSNCLWKCP